jgi:hypothetical protein
MQGQMILIHFTIIYKISFTEQERAALSKIIEEESR